MGARPAGRDRDRGGDRPIRLGIDATVDAPIGRVRVVVVHPPPPVFGHAVWADEIAAIPDLAVDDGPTVVLGDFNASWFHPPFRRAVDDAGLRDAATADGRGLSMTWPRTSWCLRSCPSTTSWSTAGWPS